MTTSTTSTTSTSSSSSSAIVFDEEDLDADGDDKDKRPLPKPPSIAYTTPMTEADTQRYKAAYYLYVGALFTYHYPTFTITAMITPNVFGCRLGAGRYVAKMLCNRPEFLSGGEDIEQELTHTRTFGGRLGPHFRGFYRFRADGQVCGPNDPTTYAVLLMDRIDGSLVRIWTMLGSEERARAKGVVDGLITALHKEGYVHGDLAPRNIGYAIRQVTVNSQPTLDYMLIDWGRTFALKDAAGQRAQAVVRFSPYTEKWHLGTNPYAETKTTLDNIMEREAAYPLLAMKEWPYIMRNHAFNRPPIAEPEKSAVFAYWLHKFTNLPIWAVFKGPTPLHYMVILPAIPTYFVDERGLLAAPNLLAYWQATTATKELMLAPVDDLLSNLKTLITVSGDWQRLSKEVAPIAQFITRDLFVDKLHFMNKVPIVDPLERGYVVSGGPRARGAKTCRVSGCGKRAAFKCSRCLWAVYCSAEHQLEDWPRHFLVCSSPSSSSSSSFFM